MAGAFAGGGPLLTEDRAHDDGEQGSPLYELVIERDYSRGVITRFDESFPPCLSGRVRSSAPGTSDPFRHSSHSLLVGGSRAVPSHAGAHQPLLPGRRDFDLYAAAGERRRLHVAVLAVLLLRWVTGATDATDGRLYRVRKQADLRAARLADRESTVQWQSIRMPLLLLSFF
jgi:hypothetical protein